MSVSNLLNIQIRCSAEVYLVSVQGNNVLLLGFKLFLLFLDCLFPLVLHLLEESLGQGVVRLPLLLKGLDLLLVLHVDHALLQVELNLELLLLGLVEVISIVVVVDDFHSAGVAL